MSQRVATGMRSEKILSFMRHIIDTAFVALNSSHAVFLMSMRSIDPSLRGYVVQVHVSKTFPPS